jgi:hypothetical protein
MATKPQLCACGCGLPVNYSREGKPQTYLRGHQFRQPRAKPRQPRSKPIRYIPLTRDQLATVDAVDYPRLSQYEWLAREDPRTGRFYAQRIEYDDQGQKRPIQMHREVMRAKEKDRVEFIDPTNTLRNTRDNLRLQKTTKREASRATLPCPKCGYRIKRTYIARNFALRDGAGRKPMNQPEQAVKEKPPVRSITCPQCHEPITRTYIASKFAKRDGAGRKPTLKDCEFCGLPFGTVEMRKHIPRCPENLRQRARMAAKNGHR